MQQGSGIILILVGFLIIYIVVTGKYPVFEEFFYKLFNLNPGTAAVTDNSDGTSKKVTTVTNQIKTITDVIEAARKATEIRITGKATGVNP